MSGQSRHATHDVSRVAEDRALFARYLDQRDPVDREMLVERFLPLARQLARRYQRPDEPFDDLFQVACLGLINAIDRFSLEREVAFSSYAVPTILGEIKRYFRDRTWSVRVPRDLQDLALKVDRAVAELDLELQRKPTVEEIGAKVGADGRRTSSRRSKPRAPTGPRRCRRHGAPMTTAATPWATSSASRSAGFALAEDRATVEHVMRVITPREREVLRLRFAEDLTQAEIGERIGLSQMQVSRIIRQSVSRLRAYAAVADEDVAAVSRRRRAAASPRNGPGLGRGVPPGSARRRIVRCTPPSWRGTGRVL